MLGAHANRPAGPERHRAVVGNQPWPDYDTTMTPE
jgi:hypothetical protein